MVDEAAAGRIDEIGGRLHLGKLGGAEGMAGFGRHGSMQRDIIAAGEQIFQRHKLNPLARELFAAAGGDDLQPQRRRLLGQFEADIAQAGGGDPGKIDQALKRFQELLL